MVTISVIMPVYNAEKHLRESISSVINQTLEGIELICVNDGSSDNSLEILNEFSENHDFIRIFTKDNEGSGIARNYGIDKAKGSYIAFLDSDDVYIDKRALEVMYESAVKHDVDMVSANLKGLNRKGEFVVNNILEQYLEEKLITPERYGIPWEFYKNIFKKSFLQKHDIAFPDLKRGQDPVFLAKVLANIAEFLTVPIDLYGFRYPKRSSMFKINNCIKRRDYIMQFRCCYDILNNAGLSGAADEYIGKLYEFIDFSYNRYNSDIRYCINNIFKDYGAILKECNNHLEIPEITVIKYVPNRKHLKKSISSISKQSFKNIEIICIGDNKKAVETLKDMATYDARIRIIPEPILVNGLSDIISTDYVYLMDSTLIKQDLLSDLYDSKPMGEGKLLNKDTLVERPEVYEDFLNRCLNNAYEDSKPRGFISKLFKNRKQSI